LDRTFLQTVEIGSTTETCGDCYGAATDTMK